MRRVFVLMLLVWVAPSAPALAEEPFADMSFAEACAGAKKADKVVLIDFYTTWCGPCKLLDQTTFKDAAVRTTLREKTIALKVDAEKEKALAAKFEVKAFPTILIVRPDETVIDRIVGYRDAKDFLADFNAALAGKDAVARAKEKAAGDKKDPMLRMRVGDELARAGRHEEALKEYLWCFDHGNEHGQGFYGVRLSFLLGDIVRLGQSFPPAIKALEERRDSAERAVLDFAAQVKAGDKSNEWDKESDRMSHLAHDLMALNRELGQSERTARVFEACRGDRLELESLRRMMSSEVFKVLLAQRRYDHIVKTMNEIIEDTPTRIGHYLDMKAGRLGQKLPADTIKVMREIMLTDVSNSYEALLGAGEMARAQKLADQVIAAEAIGETYVTLIEAAIRAQQQGAAGALVDRAKQALSPKEFEKVEAAAKALPPIG